MISGNFLFLIADDPASLFTSDSNLDKCFPDILLLHKALVAFGRINRCFIQQILQICSGKACRSPGNLLQIHIITKRLILGMHL